MQISSCGETFEAGGGGDGEALSPLVVALTPSPLLGEARPGEGIRKMVGSPLPVSSMLAMAQPSTEASHTGLADGTGGEVVAGAGSRVWEAFVAWRASVEDHIKSATD